MTKYQDIYPSEPIVRSQDTVRQRAADLMNVEYFEADPGTMPTATFDQHHVLISLKSAAHRVENWRAGQHRDFIFHKNEIVVTPAGIESGWRWHEKSRCIVVTLDPETLERFTQNELGILLTAQQLVDLPQFEDEDIAIAASQLVDTMNSRSNSSAVMYESLARIFLVKLVERYGEERREAEDFSPSFSAKKYKSVLDYIGENYGRSITVEDIGRAAGLSPTHFTRLFKEVIGDTPYQFLMRYRVEQSEAKLSDKSQPLIDIAHSCGFSDQAHFSRTFKKYKGISPKAYRKER